jgi:hypothetical protein
MEMTNAAIVAAVRELNEKAPIFMPLDALEKIASLAVIAATPLIRAAVLEEAAKVAEEWVYAGTTHNIAAAIRALKPPAESSAA